LIISQRRKKELQLLLLLLGTEVLEKLFNSFDSNATDNFETGTTENDLEDGQERLFQIAVPEGQFDNGSGTLQQ
jgi:hypothetical protein